MVISLIIIFTLALLFVLQYLSKVKFYSDSGNQIIMNQLNEYGHYVPPPPKCNKKNTIIKGGGIKGLNPHFSFYNGLWKNNVEELKNKGTIGYSKIMTKKDSIAVIKSHTKGKPLPVKEGKILPFKKT